MSHIYIYMCDIYIYIVCIYISGWLLFWCSRNAMGFSRSPQHSKKEANCTSCVFSTAKELGAYDGRRESASSMRKNMAFWEVVDSLCGGYHLTVEIGWFVTLLVKSISTSNWKVDSLVVGTVNLLKIMGAWSWVVWWFMMTHPTEQIAWVFHPP